MQTLMSPSSATSGSGAAGSFSRQIWLVLLLVLAVALLGSTLGFWSLFRVSVQTHQMVDEAMPAERLTSELQRHILINVARSRAFALSAEPQVGDALAPEIKQTAQHIDALLRQLGGMLTTADDQRILGRMVQTNTTFNNALQVLTVARDSGVSATIEQVYATRFTPAVRDLQQAVAQLGDSQRARIEASAAGIDAVSRMARWGLVLFSACALCLGGFWSLWLVRRITRPIQQAVATADQVAALDLRSPIDGHERDEAGRLLMALGRMQSALHALVQEVQGASHNVAEGATQIAAGNLDSSGRAEMTASFLQQTAAAVEEISATLHASLQASMRGETLAHAARREATSGSVVMSEVMQTMDEIHGASRRIVDITGVIDSLAFQTNILALNAAVEAARAGEQGRGFAVVAAEVRTLANRSAVAAREIKALIDAAADKITLGAAKVREAQTTMGGIVNSVEQVTEAIGEVHAGSRAQSSSMASIHAAVTHLDQLAQQNAAVVEESAAAAQNLQHQAGYLRDLASRFKLPGMALALR